MIVVFSHKNKKTSIEEYDFIVQTSIDFAFSKCGGPVVAYSKDLNFKNVDRLALVGHGSIGKIEEVSAEVIGTHLSDPVRGVRPTEGSRSALTKLIVTSCFGGSRQKDASGDGTPGTSTVEILADYLRGCGCGGLEIVGYRGPSIKSASLGAMGKGIAVVNANDGPKLNDLIRAFRLQEQAKGKNAALLGSLTTNTTPTLEQAQNAAATSSAFYPTFVELLEKANLLKSDGKMIRVAVVLD